MRVCASVCACGFVLSCWAEKMAREVAVFTSLSLIVHGKYSVNVPPMGERFAVYSSYEGHSGYFELADGGPCLKSEVCLEK